MAGFIVGLGLGMLIAFIIAVVVLYKIEENKKKYESEDYKKLMNKIKKHLDNEVVKNPKFFYDKKVFEMYYEDDNTFRGLGELLDIPMSSIYNTVTKSRTKLVKKFKKDIEIIRAKLNSYNESI